MPMRVTPYEERARSCLQSAGATARRLGHAQIGTAHVLFGLANVEGVHRTVFARHGVSAEKLGPEIDHAFDFEACAGEKDFEESRLPFAAETLYAHERAAEEAMQRGAAAVHPEHLLLGILRDPMSSAAQVLKNLGVDPEKIRSEVAELLGPRCPRNAKVSGPVAARPLAFGSEGHGASSLSLQEEGDVSARAGGGAGPAACPGPAGAKGACSDDALCARLFDVELACRDLLRAQCEQEERLRELVAVLRRLWVLGLITAAAASALAAAALLR